MKELEKKKIIPRLSWLLMTILLPGINSFLLLHVQLVISSQISRMKNPTTPSLYPNALAMVELFFWFHLPAPKPFHYRL